ncbi:MAG: class I SAM-dependent methyltransferase [Devosiaceae bacterium]|nr:class I SAM-dependent methyltransferase [Devosiaceae bacterium]
MSRLIAAHYPQASFTLVDISAKMLEIALEHPILDSIQVRSRHLDLTNISTLEGKYDIIVSSLAIHHLTSAEKEKLFNALPDFLNPGGIFINADQSLGNTEQIEKLYQEEWLKTVRKKDVSEKTLETALERMKEDKMDTLQDQMHWSKNAGFTGVNCWYQNYSFCGYSGVMAG